MTTYKVTLLFTNLDNFMGTHDQASMTVEIQSDSYGHAMLLAQRLQKVMDADYFTVDEQG